MLMQYIVLPAMSTSYFALLHPYSYRVSIVITEARESTICQRVDSRYKLAYLANINHIYPNNNAEVLNYAKN